LVNPRDVGAADLNIVVDARPSARLTLRRKA